MAALEAALSRLGDADQALRAGFGALRSLCPSGRASTPLRALGEALLVGEAEPARVVAFAEGLREIALAQAEHFPETIFWDLDHLAASLWEGPHDAAGLAGLASRIAGLQAGFGRGSALCFRYTHDFMYGYDWARWVGRAPEERAAQGPFSEVFVTYMERRREELLALIARDDEKYHWLPAGQPRNPFSFSREPAEEARLLSALAARDEVPVRAWRLRERPRWSAPFAELRVARAAALGIPVRS